MMEIFRVGRIQFSVRSLLIVTAVSALLLTPAAWVSWERQKMLVMQDGMLRAREEAIRSVLLAERRRVALRAKGAEAGSPGDALDTDADMTDVPPVSPEVLIEHLRRENNELKDTVDSLRLEVKRLRAANSRSTP